MFCRGVNLQAKLACDIPENNQAVIEIPQEHQFARHKMLTQGNGNGKQPMAACLLFLSAAAWTEGGCDEMMGKY